MSLSKHIFGYINWLRSLTRKIAHHARWRLVFGVFLFLVYQVSTLLAFFLPLKVIILLGTDGIPRYLRFFINDSNREMMIALLAVATVLFYLLAILSEYLMQRAGEAASAKIMASSRKTSLFDRQGSFAETVFNRVVQTWGAILMLLLGGLAAFLLEPRVFLVLVGLMVAEYLGFHYWWNYSRRPGHLHARIRFQEKYSGVVKVIFAVNFFVVFGILVYLFLFDETLNFIIGILLLLLTRKVFQLVGPLVASGVFLEMNRAKIQALYYTHARLEEQGNYIEQGFYQLLMPENRGALFDSLLCQVFSDSERENLHFEWADCGLNNVAAFKGMFPVDGEKHECYWLKCYAPNRQNYFHQEKLIAENASQFDGLVPELLYCSEYKGVYLSLFRTEGGVPVPKKGFRRLVENVRMQMWLARPSSRLLNSFKRSVQPLEGRLTDSRISMLYLACDGEQDVSVVRKLSEYWPLLCSTLEDVPFCIINKQLSPNNLFLDHNHRFFLLNWARVSFDHIGSDIPFKLEKRKKYDFVGLVKAIQSNRSGADSLTPEMLELSACLAAMERDLSRQLYGAALEKARHVLRLESRIAQTHEQGAA